MEVVMLVVVVMVGLVVGAKCRDIPGEPREVIME